PAAPHPRRSAQASAAQHPARYAAPRTDRLSHRSGIPYSGRRLSLSAQDGAPLTNPLRSANSSLAAGRRGAEEAGPPHGLRPAPSRQGCAGRFTAALGDRLESGAAAAIAGGVAGRSSAGTDQPAPGG